MTMLFPYFPKYLFRLNCIGHNGIANATRSKKKNHTWTHKQEFMSAANISECYIDSIVITQINYYLYKCKNGIINEWKNIYAYLCMNAIYIHPHLTEISWIIFSFSRQSKIAMKSFVGIKWKMHVLLLLFNEAIDQLDGI